MTKNSEQLHSCQPYNPFMLVNNDGDVMIMVDSVIKEFKINDSLASDAFYRRARRALLNAIALYLYNECHPADQNFISVIKLLNCAEIKKGEKGCETTLDVIFGWWKEKNSEHAGLREYEIFKQAPPDTANRIIKNIKENMHSLGWY